MRTHLSARPRAHGQSRVRGAARAAVAGLAAVAVAATGLTGLAAPAEAVTYNIPAYGNSNYYQDDIWGVRGQISQSGSAYAFYAYVGDTLNIRHRFIFTNKKARRVELRRILPTPAITVASATDDSGYVEMTKKMAASDSGQVYCYQPWNETTTDFSHKYYVWIYPAPVVPQITTQLPLTLAVTAGTALSRSFAYTHVTPYPAGAPAVTGSGLPAGVTGSGVTLSGTPTKAGTYSVQATVKSDFGSAVTRMTLTVNPAPAATLTFTASANPTTRGTRVTFTPTVLDRYANPIANTPVVFSSTDPTDI
ncbi:MAG: hypothetical protein LBT54_03225, partial [Bifidobacteriaceae bacterium]|nr:hypothetical protein [Bifidobacteriaceae bacterium]